MIDDKYTFNEQSSQLLRKCSIDLNSLIKKVNQFQLVGFQVVPKKGFILNHEQGYVPLQNEESFDNERMMLFGIEEVGLVLEHNSKYYEDCRDNKLSLLQGLIMSAASLMYHSHLIHSKFDVSRSVLGIGADNQGFTANHDKNRLEIGVRLSNE
jgi:hypothetical protein